MKKPEPLSRYGLAVTVFSASGRAASTWPPTWAITTTTAGLARSSNLLQRQILGGRDTGSDECDDESEYREAGAHRPDSSAEMREAPGVSPGASRCYEIRVRAYFSSAIAASAFAFAVSCPAGLARSLGLLDQRRRLCSHQRAWKLRPPGAWLS